MILFQKNASLFRNKVIDLLTFLLFARLWSSSFLRISWARPGNLKIIKSIFVKSTFPEIKQQMNEFIMKSHKTCLLVFECQYSSVYYKDLEVSTYYICIEMGVFLACILHNFEVLLHYSP